MSNSSLDSAPKRFLVTQALPYANGDLHLGHLLEAIQTDIYVRHLKMTNADVLYVCADDTHGTPIEISARKQGITPETLIARMHENHIRDYAAFSINFDIFHTTNSEENRRYAELVYKSLCEKGLVEEREIEQFFDEKEGRFLPDRFIRGTCPRCNAADQYGDVCESCGATYNPTDLKDPKSMLSGTVPVLKKSRHFFVQLSKREAFLRQFTQGGALNDDMRNFVTHWIDEGLKEWCISRDGPYFGFAIPGSPGKYFYVWLDAPIGYLSSTDKWCSEHNRSVSEFWGQDSSSTLVHFIGKDIVYFHALFWPVMLDAAGFKIPDRLFVHGFLNMQEEKMSKSRGTFILASEFAAKMSHPLAREYLRFYIASKLAGNSGDIDFNPEEFCGRVNSTLVNNIGNLHHRTFVFIDRYFESTVPNEDWDADMARIVNETAVEISQCYMRADYKTAIEKIHALASAGNKYYQDSAPWALIKTDRKKAGQVMTTCVNLVRSLAVFLKPVVPSICAAVEQQFNASFCWNDFVFSIRGNKMAETKKIALPVTLEDFTALTGAAPAVASAGEKQEVAGDIIDISDFAKVQLRIGTVESAEPVPKSDKLLKLVVNAGNEKRQIVAGLAKHYSPDDLTGKQIVFIANLKPAKLMGLKSEGMVLAASGEGTLSVLCPHRPVNAGAKIS